MTCLWGGEQAAEFMYVKRAFQWEVDNLSYYETLRSVASTIGTAISIPVLHHFNTNDNLIILISTLSLISQRLTKWLAKTRDVFLASTAVGALENVFYAPARSQITRCVSSEELGKVIYHPFDLSLLGLLMAMTYQKVFATMSSLQSLSPIIATAIYSSVYNATSDLLYPWASSYLLMSACLFIMSELQILQTISKYSSLQVA